MKIYQDYENEATKNATYLVNLGDFYLSSYHPACSDEDKEFIMDLLG